MQRPLCKLALLAVISLSILARNEVPSNSFSANVATVTDTVEMEIEIEGVVQHEKLVIGLFGKDVPKTANNFKRICKGDFVDDEGRRLTYAGSPFHRIIPQFLVQSGDVTKKDGTGNPSIYGGTFKDENFIVKHEIGCVSMAHRGKDTNGSQFFIPTADVSWLNGKHVVFGRVLKGMSVVHGIEKVGSNNGKPKGSAIIKSCTVLDHNTEL